MAQIQLTYSLCPPGDFDPNTAVLPDSSTPIPAKHQTALPVTPSAEKKIESISTSPSPPGPTNAYYTALSDTILAAQQQLNTSLTAWKDAIGDREKTKEDLGKVAYGQGKAARMHVPNPSASAGAEADSSESDDDGGDDEQCAL